MTSFLYKIVGDIARIHEYILTLNDNSKYNFSDKELHFIVIGLIGFALVFILQPIFNLLAKTGHTLIITLTYVFTVIIVLVFAIEIGQGVTGTGTMDFDDIMFGVFGFLFMFAIYAIIRSIIKLIIYLIRGE